MRKKRIEIRGKQGNVSAEDAEDAEKLLDMDWDKNRTRFLDWHGNASSFSGVQRAITGKGGGKGAKGAGSKGRGKGGKAGKQLPDSQFAPLSLVHEEWADVLSGGERQRMGFARLYYHNPRFAVLDEATSAINPDEEQALYARVGDMGTTVLSIAHRLELRKFHSHELRIVGDGTGAWKLRSL